MRAALPTVSVIVPALNVENLIATQLRAVLDQETDRPFEVVVADNGSTDGTAEVARRLGVRVVSANLRPGSATARNVGAAHSTGEILLFVDADDMVTPGYVDAMVEALERFDMVGARVSQHALNEEWARAVRTIAQREGLPLCSTKQGELALPWIYGATLGITREAFERLGGFDADLWYGEDIDLSLRAFDAGLTLGFVPDAIVEIRMRHGVLSNLRQGLLAGNGGGGMLRQKYRKAAPPLDRLSFVGPLGVRAQLGPFWHLVAARSREERCRAAFLVGRRVGYVCSVCFRLSFRPLLTRPSSRRFTTL